MICHIHLKFLIFLNGGSTSKIQEKIYNNDIFVVSIATNQPLSLALLLKTQILFTIQGSPLQHARLTKENFSFVRPEKPSNPI